MFKEIIIIALIAGGIFFGYMLYQNNWNIALTTAAITGMIGGLTASIGANPTTSGVSLLSGIAGTGTIAKLAYDGLKKEATQKITEQNNVIVDKKTELDAIKGTYDTKIGSLESQIEELKLENPDLEAFKLQMQEKENVLFEKEEKIKSLVNQNAGLKDMHTGFINKLITASDGEWVIDPATSKRYQVLKLQPEIKVI